MSNYDKNKPKGWFSMYRSLEEHWLWQDPEPFDKRSAWMDLIMMANFEDKKVLFNGELIVVKQGERITSIRKLMDRWHWGNTKVTNFLKLLESDGMITLEQDSKKTRYKVVNYKDYQNEERVSQDTHKTVTNHPQVTDESLASQGQDTRKSVTNQGQDTDTTVARRNNNYNNINNFNNPSFIQEHQDAIYILPSENEELYFVTTSDMELLEEKYPTLALHHEFMLMGNWLKQDEQRLKPAEYMPKFIDNWLSQSLDNKNKNHPNKKEFLKLIYS